MKGLILSANDSMVGPCIEASTLNLNKRGQLEMRLDLEQLLDFYDYRVQGSDTHASAINAVLGEDIAVE
jgi:hypothetical protein